MSIKLKVLPVFPSKVLGDIFIAITKANGVYTIAPDYSLLANTLVGDLANAEVVVRNVLTGEYNRLPLSAVIASASFPTDVTGDHAVSPTETYLRCNLSAPASIVLPDSASREGVKLGIKDVGGNFSTNPATVTFFDTQAADGLTTITLDQNFQYLEMIPNAAGWDITHLG